MACYSPVRGYRARTPTSNGRYPLVFNPREGQNDMPMDVPCGQCIGCRLERSRQWAIRLVHENSLHDQSCFLTLTYSPEHLPKNGSLRKKDFQLFMKRLRKWLAHKKIRFFHCGEYGEKGGRPHYHAIVFGHDWSDKIEKFKTPLGHKVFTSAKLDELWGLGNTSTAEVTFESAAYVARYVTKKITGSQAFEHYNEINKNTGEITKERSPEYVTMSRRPGIGKGWFDRFHKDVFPHDEVVIRGKKMKVPKYYDQLFEKIDGYVLDEAQAKRVAAAKSPEQRKETTHERLRVREIVQQKKLDEQLKRKLK